MWGITPERLRTGRRVLLQSGFGLLVFGVALYFCFPYDRAKDLAIAWAGVQGYDVTIGSAGPGFGFAVTFKDIHVRTRPVPGGGKPVRFTIDSARVRVSPFVMFSKTTSIGVDAEAFGGRLGLDFDNQKKGPFRVAVRAKAIDLSEIPGVRESINLPLTGTLEMSLDLASASGRYAEADGALTFKCSSCVLGDGRTPLKIEGNPLLAGGLTLPKVRLGDLVGRVAIEKGNAKLQGVEAKSADGDLALEGDVQLHDPLPMSTLSLYLRFRLSDTFLKNADKLQMMLQMAGSSGKRPDGSYGVRLGGRLGAMSPPVFTTVSPSGGTGVVPGIRAGLRGGSGSGSNWRPPAPTTGGGPPPSAPPPTMNATIDTTPPPTPAPAVVPMPPPPPVVAPPPAPDTPPPAPPAAPPPSDNPAPMRGAPPPPGPEDNQAPPPPPPPQQEGEPS